MSPPKYLVVIAGPTAVGKTALAIELARYYQTEILSADSRQFYTELSIGTAKPSTEQLQEVPHHFINTKHIWDLYGAGHFEKDANILLNTLFRTRDLVVMVGGSGLYIDAVLNGVDDFIEIPPHIREELNQAVERKGTAWLQAEIQKADPVYFSTVDIHNTQRLIRALEVFRHTGLPYSSFLNKTKMERKFIPVKILINTDRQRLYTQINTRVDEMMKMGLLQEVQKVAAYKNCNALKTVGYKELYDFLEEKYTLEEAVGKIKQHTRNYAKRQLTWFKNKDHFEEFEPGDFEKIKNHIDHIRTHG